MAQLHWVETPDGWRSRPFHIERAGDAGWTLSIDDVPPGEPQALDHDGKVTIRARTTTEPMISLEACKQAANRLAAEMQQAKQVRHHGMRAAAAGAGFVSAVALPGVWTYPVAFGLAFFALREGVAIADLLSSRARIVSRPHQ